MNGYEKLAKAIIDEINSIIGPVAIMQANTVKGMKASVQGVKITANPEKAVSGLLKAYKTIIGEVAVTLAIKGAKKILKKNPRLKVPKELRPKGKPACCKQQPYFPFF